MKNHMDSRLLRTKLPLLILLSLFFQNGYTLDLTIDNRLLVVPPDCYTRVSIGSRLLDSLVISTIQANAAVDCEAACSANGTSCGSFSFGVGNRGNGSCILASRAPTSPNDLQRDPNYDVFSKGKISLRGCQTNSRQPLRPASSPTSSMNQNQNGMNGNGRGTLTINADPNGSQRLFGNNSLLNTLGNSALNRNRNRNSTTNGGNQGRPSSPFDFVNDDRLRISDIIGNKKEYGKNYEHSDYEDEKSNLWPNVNDDKWSQNKWPNDFNYYPITENHYGNIDPGTVIIEDAEKFGNFGFGRRLTPDISIQSKKPRPSADEDDYATALDDNFSFGQRVSAQANSGNISPNLWVDPSLSIKQLQNYYAEGYGATNEGKACFRRLLAGKRIVDHYVKRVMECERIHDCHRMCEFERSFSCEGFSYRPRGGSKGVCELVSMPPSRMDLGRDFVSDPRYDFYERDWTRRKCEPRREKIPPSGYPLGGYPPTGASGWWGGHGEGHRPPWPQSPVPGPSGGHRDTYIPPRPTPEPPVTVGSPPYGGTFVESTRLTFDVPRPLDYNRRPPGNWFRPGPNDIARPDHPPPLPVRPIGYYPQKPIGRPERPDDFYHDHHRGYGHPHYEPSRPSDDGHSGNGYSYGRPGDGSWMSWRYGQKYPPVRRVGYTPDPATNEIAPQPIPDRKKVPPKPVPPEPYSPEGYHYPVPKPPPPPTSPDAQYPRAPPEHDTQYGHVYNYGGAYGYSDRPKPLSPLPRECSVRSAGGFRLARGIIRKSYLTPNLGQCESLCQSQKEFVCLTFAYRYNLAATSPADNCLLSDAPLESLVFYTDLEPDRDYDIYAMTTNSKWCDSTRGRPPSSLKRPPHPPDECFWRVRSGFAMPPSVVKKPMKVDGMGECQVECVNARDFTCRSFVFRYESPSRHGLPNCYLSDWPALEVDPNKMQDMDGAELYERGSFGRGCEPRHPIPLPSPPVRNRPAIDYKPARSDEASCYAGYERPCKLTPYAVVLATKVDSEDDCRKKCTVMRQNVGREPPCMSFSFKIREDDHGDNCHLSDVPTRDLRPGLDYIHDEDYTLYVFKELEPRCSFGDEAGGYPFSPAPPPPIPPQKPFPKPEDPYYYGIPLSEPNKPGTAVGPAYHIPQEKPLLDDRFFYPPELSVFNRYTVNGLPCKRGTKCERNPLAGFWACEPEGAAPDEWDYCCEPSHSCGYSHGFSYPWCYVGGAPDQWRPCSERYYPYSPKPPPVRPLPGRPSYTKCEYSVDCEGRHWPVAVLHGEAPPNGTDSVAQANDHREVNQTISEIPAVKSIDDEGTNSTLKRRKVEDITLLPLRIISSQRWNTTERNTSESQRLNSRYKTTSRTNSSLESLARVSRDGDSPQYFITRRLNAGLATLPGDRQKSKASVAKIERITKNNDVTVNAPRPTAAGNGDLVNSTAIPSFSKRWVKMETIDAGERSRG